MACFLTSLKDRPPLTAKLTYKQSRFNYDAFFSFTSE